MEKEIIIYRRFNDLFYTWRVEHKRHKLIPLLSPFGVSWVGRCGLQEEQAGIDKWKWQRGREVHIKEAGHILEVVKSNVMNGGHEEDSTPVVEEIERAPIEEEHSGLLGKLKSEVVVEEGGFT